MAAEHTSMTPASSEPAPSPHPEPILVVVNPGASRLGPDERSTLDVALSALDHGHRLLETRSDPGSGRRIESGIHDALAAGCRRFVAVGGDGTVAQVAGALLRARPRCPSAVLGIVPAGTANVLARDLGLPLSLPAAIALALGGDHTLELDVMVAGDRPVLTQVGIGVDAQMIRHTSREARNRHGRLAYAREFLKRFLRASPARFEISIDGEEHRFRAWQVVVANVGALGAPSFTWGPAIDPSDGILDVCIYRARGLRESLKLVPRVLSGRHHRDAASDFLKARERVVIRTHGPMLVQGDGEVLGRTPVTLDFKPHALRVCVPRPVPPPPDPEVALVEAEAAMAGPPKPLLPAPLQGGPPPEAVVENVETMVAQRSRTWILQGWWRHPATFLGALDAALFLRINEMQLGPWADRGLLLVSRVMHYGEGWAIVAALHMTQDFPGGIRAAAEALPVLWGTMLIVNYPLKRIFRRKRPFRAYVHARVTGPQPEDYSFPSGHTAAAFAGALLFSANLPGTWPAYYLLAAIVGFSRVYLGVHYPGDVLVGAAIGTGLAAGLLELLRAIVNRM